MSKIPHRYDWEGITFHRRPEPAWKRDPLLKSAAVKDWVYHLGSDEKKTSYLKAMKTFLKFTGKTPESLIQEAAVGEGYAIDDRLKGFLADLEKNGVSEDERVEYYLGARSFFVWNGFIEKLRAVPPSFRKVVATNSYNYHEIIEN
jgi:hypothetical protein